MIKVSAASAFVAAAATVLAHGEIAAARECSVLLGCAGLERTRAAAPDDSAPDANSGTPPSDANPDDGMGDDRAQSPGDDGTDDDDGNHSNQASPPDAAQPPGCIFRDQPLDLLV